MKVRAANTSARGLVLCLVIGALCLLVPSIASASEPAFTPVPGSPLTTTVDGRSGVAFSPSGGLLAAGTSMFSVGPSGALTPVGGAAPDPYAGAVAFSPNGALLAAADEEGSTPSGGHTISMFSVGSSGALTAVSGSPFAVGYKPTSISFSPSGNLLAVTAGPLNDSGARGPDELYLFSVNSSGELTPASGSPYSVSASQVVFSPAGGLLATVEVNSGVTMFSVSSSGALSKVSGSPFKAFGAAASAAAFGPGGNFLAVSNFSGGVTMYAVDSSGALTPVGSGPFDPELQSNGVAFSPSGSTVAATQNDGPGVTAFSVGASGALTVLSGSPFATSAPPTSVAFSSTGLLSTQNLGSELTTLSPSSTSSATSWVGAFGKDGYDLAGWSGQSDLSDMPGVSVTLVKGARYVWATNTSDTRALPSPDGLERTAATYYDSSQIEVKLSFKSAYTGNLRLYAVDWDSKGRQEEISVGGHSVVFSGLNWSAFSRGEWALFPISVAAGGSVTITVTRQAGVNAVLSGIFLGDEGPPPAVPSSKAPQGNWVGTYGSAGYLLADWSGTQDLSDLPGVTATLLEGGRYRWTSSTTEVRALTNPGDSTRVAAAYSDKTQIRLQLSFKSAYTGSLELYALDWDKLGRRETITIGGETALLSSDFSQGAWVSFPISVPAGGTVLIVVDRTAGINAVLSGIFLN
jgi:6-phosphogluconolactonase